jgi:hypothetical protein
VVYIMAAPTVKLMSSCRATSFYLAPGVMRYFREHILVAVLPDGNWIEIHHRADIARLQKSRPDWDGTVLCSKVRDTDELYHLLIEEPTKVERWQLDARIIEGRREQGGAYELLRLFETGDPTTLGGVRQVLDQLFPGANKTLRKAVEERLGDGANSAMRLSFAVAMRGILTDDEIAAALLEPSLSDTLRWGWESPQEIRTLFLTATRGLSQERRQILAKSLVSVAGRGAHETYGPGYARAIREGAVRHELALKITREGSDDAKAQLGGVCDAEIQRILVNDTSAYVREALSTNPGLAEDVRAKLLDDPAPNVFAAVIRDCQDLETLERYAFGANEAHRQAALGNPHATAEMQIRMLQQVLESGDRSAAWALVRVAKDEQVLDAIIESVSIAGIGDVVGTCVERLSDQQLERIIERAGDDWITVLGDYGIEDPRVQQRLLAAGAFREVSMGTNLTKETQQAILRHAVETGESTELLERVIGSVHEHGAAELDESLQRYAITLMGDPAYQLRFMGRPELTEDVVRELLTTDNRNMALGLTATAARMAEELIHSADDAASIARPLARNKHLEGPGRTLALEYAPDNFARRVDLSHDEQLSLLRTEDSIVRVVLAGSEHTDTSILRRLSRDSDEDTQRRAVETLAAREARPATAEYHFRERMAETRTVSHPIVDELREAAVCVNRSAYTEVRYTADDARHISDLPGADTIEFRGVRDVQDRIDGQSFTVAREQLEPQREDAQVGAENSMSGSSQLVARVIDNGRELRENAEYMGNCTSGYAARIAGGGTQIIQMLDEDGRCQLNVELERDDEGIWHAAQTNSRFNGYGHIGDAVPEDIRSIGETLAGLMNEGGAL